MPGRVVERVLRRGVSADSRTVVDQMALEVDHIALGRRQGGSVAGHIGSRLPKWSGTVGVVVATGPEAVVRPHRRSSSGGQLQELLSELWSRGGREYARRNVHSG
jgi:hypothetical protein